MQCELKTQSKTMSMSRVYAVHVQTQILQMITPERWRPSRAVSSLSVFLH